MQLLVTIGLGVARGRNSSFPITYVVVLIAQLNSRTTVQVCDYSLYGMLQCSNYTAL